MGFRASASGSAALDSTSFSVSEVSGVGMTTTALQPPQRTFLPALSTGAFKVAEHDLHWNVMISMHDSEFPAPV